MAGSARWGGLPMGLSSTSPSQGRRMAAHKGVITIVPSSSKKQAPENYSTASLDAGEHTEAPISSLPMDIGIWSVTPLRHFLVYLEFSSSFEIALVLQF